MKTNFTLLVAMVVLAMWAGCSRPEPPGPNGDRGSQPANQVASSQSSSLAPLEVRVGDETDLAKLIEQNRGKVILVDFWATWCPPCMELLPHTLEMAKKYADRGLVVILVAINDPKEQAEEVKTVLEKNQAAGVVNLLCRYGIGSEAVEKFEIDGGSLPHLRLYDREGRVQARFGAMGMPPLPARIELEVERLLGSGQETAVDEPTAGPELVFPENQSPSAS